MTQTIEQAESLAALAGRGQDLARQLQHAKRPNEMLALAREIDAIWSQMQERVHARAELKARAILRAEGNVIEPGESAPESRARGKSGAGTAPQSVQSSLHAVIDESRVRGEEAAMVDLTREGLEQLQSALLRMEAEILPAVRENPAATYQDRDFRENASYHEAKRRMSEVLHQIDRLKGQIDTERLHTRKSVQIQASGEHGTAFAQIAADALGIPVESIEIRQDDDDQPVKSAVLRAAQDARNQVLRIAAADLEVSVDDLEIIGGRVGVKGVPAKSRALSEIYLMAERAIRMADETSQREAEAPRD